MVGHRHANVSGAASQRRHPTRQAGQMMRVNDVRTRNHTRQSKCKRVRRVATHPADRAQSSNSESAGLALCAGSPAKCNQLAVHMTGKGASQLERVALASAI